MKFQLHPIIYRVGRGKGGRGKEEEEGCFHTDPGVTNLTVQRPVWVEKFKGLVLRLLI